MLIGQFPAIMQLPDVSKWYFNTMMGMGDKTHNIALRLKRQGLRESKPIKKLALWGIWNGLKTVENQADITPPNPFKDSDIMDIDSFPEHEDSDFDEDFENDEDTKNAVNDIISDMRHELMSKNER